MSVIRGSWRRMNPTVAMAVVPEPGPILPTHPFEGIEDQHHGGDEDQHAVVLLRIGPVPSLVVMGHVPLSSPPPLRSYRGPAQKVEMLNSFPTGVTLTQ